MNDFFRQFKGKDHGPLVQFIKYAIAGGIATVVHVLIFYLLAWKIFPAINSTDPVAGWLNIEPSNTSDNLRAWFYVLDYFVAFMISNFVVYKINVKWVFEPGRHSRGKELSLFYLVSGGSVGIGVLIGWILINYYGMSTTPTFIINIIVCLLINYVVRKFVIFKG